MKRCSLYYVPENNCFTYYVWVIHRVYMVLVIQTTPLCSTYIIFLDWQRALFLTALHFQTIAGNIQWSVFISSPNYLSYLFFCILYVFMRYLYEITRLSFCLIEKGMRTDCELFGRDLGHVWTNIKCYQLFSW